MLEERGIDPERVVFAEPTTVEEFRFQTLKILNSYLSEDENNRPPMMLVLDSLGALSTNKELADSSAGKDTRDMTRAQLIRGTFRTITQKLSRAHVPMIITNHTYDTMDEYSPQVMSGGGGLKYAGDQIIFLSKTKDWDDEAKEVTGNIIHATMIKNRIAKENTKVHLMLSYETGLDPYYGLLPLATKYGVFEIVQKEQKEEKKPTKDKKDKKAPTQYIVNGKKFWGKTINENPKDFYTPEVLKLVDEAAKAEYEYGSKGVKLKELV